MFKGKKERKI